MIWFAAGASISLFTGRLTFALGIAIALAAVFAAQRGWRPLRRSPSRSLTPLASPVAALFLACAAVAHAVAERSRAGLELAVAALGDGRAAGLAFPEGGTEPFVFSSFQPAILIAIAVFLAIPKEERLLRYGVAAYAAALAGAFLIDTPDGRQRDPDGRPLPRARARLRPLAPPEVGAGAAGAVPRLLAVVPGGPRPRDRCAPSPRSSPATTRRSGTSCGASPDHQRHRVEVLPAEHHWEAAHVPRGIYIARGWERQLDRKLNALFYEDESGPLTAAAYRAWLDDLAVGFVAVPDATLDYAAEAEARLIAKGLPYLTKAFVSADWTVYRVERPRAARLRRGHEREADPGGLHPRSPTRPGAILVKVRWTPYWSIEEGTGCVEESPSGFTRVDRSRAGPVPDRRRLQPAARARRRPALRRPPARHQRVGGGGQE